MIRRLLKLARVPTEEAPIHEHIFGTMSKYVVPFLHPSRHITRKILVSYVHLVFSKLCFFGGPLMLKAGINSLQAGATFDPTLLFLGYGLCYTGSILFESLRNIKVMEVSNEAIKDISQQAYKHILKLNPEFFFASSQREKLFKLSRALNSIEQNLRTLNQFLVPMFVDIVASSVLLYATFGSAYVCTFLASFSLYSIFTIKYSDYRRAGVRRQRNTEKEVDSLMSETFANYYNVKYYSADGFEAQRYLAKLQANYHHTVVNQNTLGILNTVQRLLFSSGMTINMIMAARAAKSQLMSAGDIVMMQSLMLQLINPLFFLGTMYRNFTDSFVDIKELFAVLHEKPTISDPINPLPCGQLKGNIQFRNVAFKYGNQAAPIIEKLNFEIQPGEFVALMGPSGVGKSTVFKLLFRLYDPQEGEILLDGQDIKQLKLEDFRSQICVVSQTAYLFNDSVMNNIVYNNPAVSKEEVYSMADQLGLHKLILSLPNGYNTPVGEKGSLFSGGERQRLSLLRALINHKKIILLDEPTSSLDAVSEERVARVLGRYRNSTRIMITHRQSLSRIVDRTISIARP